MKEKLDLLFGISKIGSTINREIVAGLTTFISMAYIMFVNPSILGMTGMDKGAVFTATAIASAIGCVLMGLLANYPIAMAPGMGINAFFAFSVCIGMGIPWQTAMAGVFVASIIFLVITAFKIREMIIDSIPIGLKYAISTGIGMFVACIGLQQGGIIVDNPATLVSLGPIEGTTWLTIFGLLLSGILLVRNVPGSIFIGMIGTSALGIILGFIPMPTQVVGAIPSLEPTLGVALHYIGEIHSVQMFIVVFTFLLVTFFDTAGSLVGMTQQAGIMKDGKMPRIGRALFADSVAMMGGSVLGTSPVCAYVESSAGIAVGGRTGFVAIIVAICFLIGMFFSPLLAVVTPQVTAPALILIGVFMCSSAAKVDWEHLEIAIPSFVIILGMPLTYSISDGLALGFILYPILMIAKGKIKDVHPLMYVLSGLFLLFLYILNS